MYVAACMYFWQLYHTKTPMQYKPVIFFLDKTDSTNREMWRRLDSGHITKEFTVLHAGSQSQGRGLGGTTWESDAGKNLLFSVLLKPSFLSPARQFMLNKAISLGIREALVKICPCEPFFIKWPNDIYARRAKIAGTLIENRIMGKTYEAAVAGTGVNVNQKSFPADIPNPVSLSLLSGDDHDLREVLFQILESMGRYYRLLRSGAPAAIDTAYLEHLLGYGEYMTYKSNGQVFEAIVTGVNDYGKIQLRDRYGNTREYGMKEVAMIS